MILLCDALCQAVLRSWFAIWFAMSPTRSPPIALCRLVEIDHYASA
jgi:hypothetical protein